MPDFESPFPNKLIVEPILAGATELTLQKSTALDNQLTANNNALILGRTLGTETPAVVSYTNLSTTKDLLYLAALGINTKTHPVLSGYHPKILAEGFLSATQIQLNAGTQPSFTNLLPRDSNFLTAMFPASNARFTTISNFQTAFSASLSVPPGSFGAVSNVRFNTAVGKLLYLTQNPAITSIDDRILNVRSSVNKYVYSPNHLLSYSAVSTTNTLPADFFNLPYTKFFAPITDIPLTVATDPFQYILNGPNNYIFTNNAYIAYLSAVSANINTLNVTSLSTDVISSTKAYFDNLYATTSYLTSISATQLTSLSAFIDNLSTTNISALYIEAAKISATELTALSSFNQYLSSVAGIVDTLSSYNLSTTHLTALSGYIPQLTSINLTSTNISALYLQSAEISSTKLTALSSYHNYLSATSGIINSLSIFNLSTTYLTALSGNISELSSNSIKTAYLTATDNISAKNIYVDTLSAKNLRVDNLAEKLDDLTDVVITSVSPGHILMYDGTQWVNQPVIGGSGNLDDLLDVEIKTPITTGQVLVYNGSKWINNAVPGGGGGGASTLNDLLDVVISSPPAPGDILKYNGSEWINTTETSAVYVSLSANSLSGENLTLYNTNTSIPALRVTQEGEQHVAVFYDRRGRPDLNINNIVVGGILNPGSNEVFVFATNKANGVSAWGSNPSGQLLDANTLGYSSPVYRDINVKQISTFGMHVVALSSNNTLTTWGLNVDGQLGNDTLINSNSVINLGGNYRYVAAGSAHSAAINNLNTLYTWGRNLFGELGVGLSGPGNAFKKTPQLVGTGYIKVACGGNHTIALKQDNTLWCWGSNEYGQLGFQTFLPHIQTTPVQVTTRKYKSISCGLHHSAAIDEDDNLWVWGANGEGQIGAGSSDLVSIIPYLIPDLKFKQVYCGYYHTLAITIDGLLYAWGKNNDGQLGRGDTSSADTNIPILIGSFEYCAAGPNCSFGISINGDVYAWGNNEINQLASGVVDPNIPFPFNTFVGDPAPSEVALIITGSEQAPGFVGIKTDSPNCELTVNGSISASGTIFGNISSDIITSNYLTSVNISANRGIINSLDSTTANITSINALSARIKELSATNFKSITLTSLNLSSNSGFFADLTSTNLSAVNGNINNLTSVYLTGVSAFFDNLSSRALYTDSITAKSAKIDGDLEVTGSFKGNLKGNTTSDSLCSTNITGTNIFALSALAVGTTSIDLITSLNTKLYVDGNAIITGNLSALGDITYLDTDVISTTALEVSNPGTRTSLTIKQSGGLDVARFYYYHQGFGSGPALVIKGHADPGVLYGPGYVGVRTETPNEALTVQGNISASGNIYTDTGILRTSAVSTTFLSAIKGHIDNITFNIDSLTTRNITVTSLSAQKLTGIDIITNTITAVSGYFNILTAVSGFFDHLSAKSAEVLEISSRKINTDYLSAINLEVNNLTSYGVPDFQTDITVRGNANVLGNLSADRIYGTLYTTNVVNVGDAIDIIEVKAQRGRFTDNLSARAIITPWLTATHAKIDFITQINTPIGYITSLSVNNLTAKYAEIDFIKQINTPVGYVTSLSVQTITADSSTINNLTINTLSARNLILEDDSVRCLHIKQSGGAEALRIDYKDSADIVNPAIVVRTSDDISNPIYGPGYVGIRTESPTEALTVNGNILTNTGNITANGNIVGNNISARVALSAGTVIRGTSLNVNEAQVNNNLDVTGNATVTNLTSYNTVYIGGRTDINNDLHVTGRIYGQVTGTITNSGTVKLNDISAINITTDFLTAKNSILTPTLSANYIITDTGNSSMWTSAYYIPITINLIINGGGVPITPSTKGYIELPYNIKLQSWSMFADDISVFPTAMYVLSSDYASFPDTEPIFTEAPTILPGEIKNKSTSLAGWVTDLPSGTVLHFGVSAVPIPGGIADLNATLLTLSLRGYRY